MYKSKTFILLGLSLALLAGLFLFTRLVDRRVDNRFSGASQPQVAPESNTEQPPKNEGTEQTPYENESTPENETLPENEDPLESIQQVRNHIIYDNQNQPHLLESFVDRPVVLYFWASHNKASTAGLSVMETFFQQHGSQVYFLVVNVTDGEKETRETADAYLAENNYSFPIYYDLDGLCTEYYKKSVPLAIFFGSDGNAVTYFNEQPTSSLMERCFEKILN